MPIAIPATPGPLRQGDILKGLSFYVTGADGPVLEDVPYCVVLSRDCVALRADAIIVAVAEIRKYAPDAFTRILSGELSLDEARRTMDALRDGDAAPDTCYVGPLLAGEQRYAISLDRIHTIDVPVGRERDAWIQQHREFQLEPDFVRHVQVRLFSSVAKQGFDDLTWWPTQDLDALIIAGKKWASDLSAKHAEAQLEFKNAEISQANQGQLDGRRRHVSNCAAALDEAMESLAPYEAELQKRTGGPAKH